jgi:hypothetical protein
MRGEDFVAHLDGLGGTPVAHHWFRVLFKKTIKLILCNFVMQFLKKLIVTQPISWKPRIQNYFRHCLFGHYSKPLESISHHNLQFQYFSQDAFPFYAISALMMEAERTSETLVIFYQTSRRYTPEDSHLHLTTVRTSNPTFYLI